MVIGRDTRRSGPMLEAALAIVRANDKHGAEATPFAVAHGFHIFGPVHRRRAHEPRRVAHAHQQIRLVAKSDRRVLGSGCCIGGVRRQRQPASLPVLLELSAIELAIVEQIHVGGAVGRIESAV